MAKIPGNRRLALAVCAAGLAGGALIGALFVETFEGPWPVIVGAAIGCASPWIALRAWGWILTGRDSDREGGRDGD